MKVIILQKNPRNSTGIKPKVKACRDADGTILTETEHIQRRWK
jgi:hypothetical protein